MGNSFSSFHAVFQPNGDLRVGRRFFPRRSFQPKPPLRSSEVDSSGIAVLTITNLDVNIEANTKHHRTDRFHIVKREKDPRLVIRRGQPFTIHLTLSREYNPNFDAISFIFTFADVEKPFHGQGTLVAVPLLENDPTDGTWGATIISSDENVLGIRITTAANCLVGEWKLEIDTKLQTGTAVNYSFKPTIFVLFNPWCEDDNVYLEGETLRQEYVLADTGLIWRGTAAQMRPAVWKYAQFEQDILECSLYLIWKIGKIPVGQLGDPVKIARALGAAVNSPDDYGAVLGNWTTDFGGGTAPTKWLGSMKILQQYWKTKKPVKYGQCWIFAGVLSTISRAIGIPARIITNYSSAHDTQGSLTVDYFVNERGKIMEELNSDSIWNFHVWNELWMRRPDLELEGECDGWQVVDATPQELSDGMFRCGPASVVAVKRAEVLRPYDGQFVYSEVNADKLFWKYAGPTQPLKLMRKDILGIGRLMSTKAVGKWTREDITKDYKFPEKSEEERSGMLRALKTSENLFSRYYLNEDFNDIYFDFILRDDIVVGSPFTVALVVENRRKDKEYKVKVSLRVDAVTYTGKIGPAVKKARFEPTIKAGSTEEITMEVTYEEYARRMLNQGAFNIACLATVIDTNYEYFGQDDFRVRKPDIKFQINGNTIQGNEITVSAYFKNPLPVAIKNGVFRIEGGGVENQLKLKLSQITQPSEELRVEFTVTPKTAGKNTIVAKFQSNELDDVDGFIEFMVSAPIEN